MAGTLAAGEKMTAAKIGVPPWTAMAGSYTNTWSDLGGGNCVGQYRKWVLLNSVEIIGSISHASISGSSAFFTMPAGFIPSSAQSVCACASSSAICSITVSAAGVLTIFGLSASTFVQFHGWYSLDA